MATKINPAKICHDSVFSLRVLMTCIPLNLKRMSIFVFGLIC